MSENSQDRIVEKLSSVRFSTPDPELRQRTLRATRIALEQRGGRPEPHSWWVEGLIAAAVALMVSWPHSDAPASTSPKIDLQTQAQRLHELENAVGRGLGPFGRATTTRSSAARQRSELRPTITRPMTESFSDS